MPTVQISITKSEKEWAIIEKSIREKHKIKNLGNASLLNNYIRNEIQRTFSNRTSASSSAKIKRNRRGFTLKLENEVFSALQCAAYEIGVDPSEFISILLLSPHITPASLLEPQK